MENSDNISTLLHFSIAQPLFVCSPLLLSAELFKTPQSSTGIEEATPPSDYSARQLTLFANNPGENNQRILAKNSLTVLSLLLTPHSSC